MFRCFVDMFVCVVLIVLFDLGFDCLVLWCLLCCWWWFGVVVFGWALAGVCGVVVVCGFVLPLVWR